MRPSPPNPASVRCSRHRASVGLLALIMAATACGGNSSAEPLRSYTLHLRTDDSGDEYDFVAEDEIDLRVGDEVTFELDNTGTLTHDLQIVDPSGQSLGTAPAANPGSSTSVTVLFDEAGYYRLNCLVDNHLTEHRMQAIVEVTDT